MHTAHTWIYLILDRWPDDLTSHEEDDKFFSRTPILLSALLTLEAIKVFQVTDISDNKYRHFFPRSVMIYLKNITLIDENNIQEASFRSKQDASQGHSDVLIYLWKFIMKKSILYSKLKKTNINFYTTNIYL